MHEIGLASWQAQGFIREIPWHFSTRFNSYVLPKMLVVELPTETLVLR